MDGRECTDCDVGTFQDKPFHTDTVCISCSGKNSVQIFKYTIKTF